MCGAGVTVNIAWLFVSLKHKSKKLCAFGWLMCVHMCFVFMFVDD